MTSPTPRPPVPDRWELRLGNGILLLLLAGLQMRSRRSEPAPAEAADPAVRQWLTRRREERARHPWRGQVAVERTALQALVSLWLAWRSYTLERGDRERGGPDVPQGRRGRA